MKTDTKALTPKAQRGRKTRRSSERDSPESIAPLAYGYLRTPETNTLAGKVYQRLREDIVAGKLAPNSKLKLEQLLLDYDVGMSPLREALSRLVGDMLVTTQGQRGFWVAPLSLSELEDITRVRALIETEALALSLQNGDENWLKAVEQVYSKLAEVESRLPEDDSEVPAELAAEWEASNRQFHSVLLSACNSVWLLRLTHILYQQLERYRRISLTQSRGHRDIAGEHAAIFRAVRDRKLLKACELVEQHIRLTADEVGCAIGAGNLLTAESLD